MQKITAKKRNYILLTINKRREFWCCGKKPEWFFLFSSHHIIIILYRPGCYCLSKNGHLSYLINKPRLLSILFWAKPSQFNCLDIRSSLTDSILSSTRKLLIFLVREALFFSIKTIPIKVVAIAWGKTELGKLKTTAPMSVYMYDKLKIVQYILDFFPISIHSISIHLAS